LAIDPNGKLYAFTQATGLQLHLFTIATDGTVTDLGALAGLTGNNVPIAGFGPDGTFYIGNNVGQVFKVDVASMTATGFPGTDSAVRGDFAFANGVLVSAVLGATTFGRVNTTTGAVTNFNVTGVTSPGFGPASLWSFGEHLYAGYGNRVFEIFGFATATTTTPATAVQVTTLATAAGDGASCLSAPSPFLDAADDDFTGTPIRVVSGGTAGNVLTNDTRNGVAVNASDVTSSITDDGGLTGAALGSDGSLTVPAGTSPGTYSLTYKICRTDNTSICDTAVATVTVARDAIDAVDDSFGKSGGNVLTNDTLKGAAVSSADVALTLTSDGGLTGAALASDGVLSVPANAAPGTYTLTYEMCQNADQANCDTASITVVIPDPNVDSDKDGLTDGKESSLHSNPQDPDTDDDGLKDGTEYNGFTMAATIYKCSRTRVPYGKVRTNLLKRDTDGDGNSDRTEVKGYYGIRRLQTILTPNGGRYVLGLLKSHPSRVDTDSDGLPDRVEALGLKSAKFNHAKTDPANCHTDLGRINDGSELLDGKNPIVAGEA